MSNYTKKSKGNKGRCKTITKTVLSNYTKKSKGNKGVKGVAPLASASNYTKKSKGNKGGYFVELVKSKYKVIAPAITPIPIIINCPVFIAYFSVSFYALWRKYKD